ncbi:hypothetical protein [Nocardia salmonicida]|uniref:hypothetical protein n=1 Tax=Nocardia salmonicida TaxID=53431 RepID=UPI0012F4D751|nr:hypothetical protein [Nocardia salmonicida]
MFVRFVDLEVPLSTNMNPSPARDVRLRSRISDAIDSDVGPCSNRILGDLSEIRMTDRASSDINRPTSPEQSIPWPGYQTDSDTESWVGYGTWRPLICVSQGGLPDHIYLARTPQRVERQLV